MAATDKPYRNQKTLDIVFAVSCILMLLSGVWMIVQDYDRDWKGDQRKFRDVETAVSERLMLEKLPDAGIVATKRQAAEEARKEFDKAKAEVDREDTRLAAEHEKADTKYRSLKAEFDSKMSLYDILNEEIGKTTDKKALAELEKERKSQREELDKLQNDLYAALGDIERINADIHANVTSKLDGPDKKLAAAEDDLKRVTGIFDRFAKATAQKRWKFGDTFRALPIVDGFASPEKIQQITLNDLTIDYGGFRDVPRYDRCTTCHLGIDRGIFDKAALTALGTVPEGLQNKLDEARKMLEERQKGGESLGYNPSDIPTTPATMKLSKGKITEFASHPRLDLFVDSNSPHPAERFGCTSCHAGQGSATDFTLASHSPADLAQEHQWEKQYGWFFNHDWEFPMQSSRFIESTCLKCHHQVTDLIRSGSKEEAPKVLKGFNLILDNGCFGCHEISGFKSNRPIGPDLRLEPAPAIDLLSAGDQERIKSDTSNPPGTMRRVGPGLRRIAEKTDEKWTRTWVYAPRLFREDTKMPHFYNLSTNSPDVLPDEQKEFPAAEIHSIVHYLFAESRSHLRGEDTYRNFLQAQLKKLNEATANHPLGEKQKKELSDFSRNLTDLALLSVPAQAARINSSSAELRRAQEKLMELVRAEKRDEAAIKSAAEDVTHLTDELIKLGQPVGVQKEIVDGAGNVIAADVLAKATAAEKDAAKKDERVKNGQRLLTEKGCLACHAREGAPVQSDSNFGPNLSRISAKIHAEGGRRWLVQWILNPNVHYARTRMPVTHLKPEEAGDVAEYLLSAEIKRSEEADGTDPKEPDVETLKRLARVYLTKAPGMTRKKVDDVLPLNRDNAPGVTEEDLQFMAADADERVLSGLNDKTISDKLKWYIGKKSIGRMGCYGCHDVPGFEQAKPIGTALNDWGKKDAARLAYEDADAFVREHYNIVPVRKTEEEISTAIAKLEALPKPLSADDQSELEELTKLKEKPWRAENGKPPFEQCFYETLEHQHQQREGFLHLKLTEPRCFDYNRIRAWDDRLRMPQFRFARTHKKGADREKEEAEAREAVMTFVLGLVADPIPLKHVYSPPPDKLAEVKGRQVIDKYNCYSCHPIRSGSWAIKPTKDQLELLGKSFANLTSVGKKDHPFAGHNAWFGTTGSSPDKLIAMGVNPVVDKENFTLGDADNPKQVTVTAIRLTDALRFTGNDGMRHDIPAAIVVPILPDAIVGELSPFGGRLVDMLVGKPGENGYLGKTYDQRFGGKPEEARSALPPPLLREGERVQPKWLYQFLLNPGVIRPEEHMLLRMPRFNMSPDESMALVNYFGAVGKTSNPGAGVTYPYLTVEQLDDRYWKSKEKWYHESADRWVKTVLPERLAELKKRAEASKDDDEKETLKSAADAVEAGLKKARTAVDDVAKQGGDAYAIAGYKLLLNKDSCLKCHSVGALKAEGAKGPNLILSADRLRPEWTLEWLANPTRMISYETLMPQNFARDGIEWQDSFAGSPIDQARAARDVLMDLPRIAELPEIRKLQPAATPAPAEGGK
jgi:mono/diheme cytochrome c family protein/cbb3-type cytochrome oxidase cytochrome c subunit